MSRCRSIPEIARLACDRLEWMRPRDISAFWTIASRLLLLPTTTTTTTTSRRDYDDHPHHRDDDDHTGGEEDAERQLRNLVRRLNSVYVRTANDAPNFAPRELAQTALGIARIARTIIGDCDGDDDDDDDGRGGEGGASRRVLRGILFADGRRGEDPSSRRLRRDEGGIVVLLRSIADLSITKLSDFDARCLCNLAYACAIAGHIPSSSSSSLSSSSLSSSSSGDGDGRDDRGTALLLFDLIAENSLRRLHEFDARELAGLVWSFEKAGLADRHVRLFDDVACRIVAGPDVVVVPREDGFGPREIATVLSAYARGAGRGGGRSEEDAALFDDLADRVVARLLPTTPRGGFGPRDLSDVAWAYATAGGGSDRRLLFRAIAAQVTSLGVLNEYKPGELCRMLSAYAKAGVSHPGLFEKVADHIAAADNLHQFKPRELSNVLLAFAKAGISNPDLFRLVADRIVSLDSLMGFDSRALSNLLWACAKSREINPICFALVADHIVALDDMGEFTPQALSNLLWAFAKCEESNPMLFDRFADHIVALDSLDGFKPQDLSNIVWAFAREGSSANHRVFDKVAAHIIALDNLSEFTPQTLSNTAWACARAKFCHPLLFGKLAAEAGSRCGEFNSQEIANMLWSYASLGTLDVTLFSSLERAVADCFGGCNSQELANIAWAYAVANVDAPHLFHNNSSFVNACMQKEDDFSVEDLSQLHQWRLWQMELTSNANVALPSSLEQKCHYAFTLARSHPSALQSDVILELRAIGIDLEEEVLTAIGYRLDALAVVRGTKVGIEVDGPFHFLASRNLTGSTMLKRRQVTALTGMPLVFIPYWEWNEQGNNSYMKRQYLRNLLG